MGPHGRRRQPADEHPRRRARARATRPTAASRRSCSWRRRCSRPASARASSRSTGAASTRTATSSPGRIRSSRRSRARWPRSRPTSTARGVEQNVVTMVFSEFGRRLEESDSAGTDHGSGGPIMLSGSAVKGGLRRRAPRRQRQPGRRPRRQDRLPHRLPVADRRVAGRRPERHPAGRPVPRHPALRRRHHADEGRIGHAARDGSQADPPRPPGARPRSGTGSGRVGRRADPPPARAAAARRGAAAVARGGRVRMGHARHAPARSRPGACSIHVYNRGMDDHDLTVVDAHGAGAQRAARVGRGRRAQRRCRARAR